MRHKMPFVIGGALIAVLAIGVAGWGQGQPPSRAANGRTNLTKATLVADDADREADRQAIRATGQAFADAYAKGDAKAVSGHWTENGEYQDETGLVLRGRAAIEKAFTEFFQEKNQGKVGVHSQSIRFPARDAAIEEGTLRQIHDGEALPNSTRYSTFHVREDGKWKIAASTEWAFGQDQLEDLDWLLGQWNSSVKDHEVQITFEREKGKPFITGHFTRKAGGKSVATGNLKIGIDAQLGRLRSWHFEEDGGHGQALWFRDGNRWVLDAHGVAADGTPTAALNIIGRVNNDQITWRSIERVVGEQPVPETLPIRLNRAATGK